jgi:hypothetical protein
MGASMYVALSKAEEHMPFEKLIGMKSLGCHR